MLTINVESEFDPELLRQAIDHLGLAVDGDPKNPRYRRHLGEALLAARRHETALDHLLIAYEARPEPRLAFLVAFAYWRLKQFASAEKYLKGSQTPATVGFSQLHLLRGRILHDSGRYAEAVNEFSQALTLNPEVPLPRWHMARALIAHAEQLEEDTTGLFRRALKLLATYSPRPEQTDEWHFLLGRVHLALQYPVDALRHLEQSRFPADIDKALLMGIALLLKGSVDLARSWLARAATQAEGRRRCEAYLCEVAAAPSEALRSMGSPDERSAASAFVDDDFLMSVFGRGAPEIEHVRRASTDWSRAGARDRTHVDSGAAGAPGRLFANLGREGTTGARHILPASSAPAVAPGDDDTTRIATQRAAAASSADVLRPQTWLDATTETMTVSPDADDDDQSWDEPSEEGSTAGHEIDFDEDVPEGRKS